MIGGSGSIVVDTLCHRLGQQCVLINVTAIFQARYQSLAQYLLLVPFGTHLLYASSQ